MSAGQGRNYTTRLFGDLTELAEYAAQERFATRGGTAWSGGTLRECVRRTRDGDATLVAQSEALMAKFEGLVFPTHRREWVADVTGYVPNVPAHIAGHPASMRRRAKREAEAAPVAVFVDIFASSSFSHSDIMTRGAAVLALARILAGYRPIELYVAFASRRRDDNAAGCVAVKIDTAPLDLAHAAWALCGVGFLRQVMFSALEGVFPSNPFPPLRESISNIAAEMLPHGTDVIAVNGVVSDVTSDPARWITERIREAAPGRSEV